MTVLKTPDLQTTPVGAETAVTPFITPTAPATDTFTPAAVVALVTGVEGIVAESEKKQLDTKFQNIAKLRKAADQGKISFTEARTRAVAAVKEATNAMPWRAEDFQQKASSFFGAYGEGWGILNKDDSEKQSQSMADKLALSHAKEMQSFYGIPFDKVTPGMQRDFAIHQQLKNGADNAKNARDAGLANKDNGLDIVDSVMAPMISDATAKVSKTFNNYKIGGKSVLELKNEGRSSESIISQLLGNDEASTQLAQDFVKTLSDQKFQIMSEYDKHVADMGKSNKIFFGADQVKKRKDALIAPIDMLISDIKSNSDAKSLVRYVTMMETSNKGALENSKSNNINFFMAREMGLVTNDTMYRYTIDPNSIKDPTVKGMLDDAMKNVQLQDMQNWWHQVNMLPSNFDVLSKANPQIADISFLKVKDNMPKLLIQGFKGSEDEIKKQQDFFTAGSYMYLFKTSPTQMASIENMEKTFFDPNYQKRFKELPADKQAQIVTPLRSKLIDVIYNENSGTGVLQRILESASGYPADTIKYSIDEKTGEIGAIFTPPEVGRTPDDVKTGFHNQVVFLDNMDRLNKYINAFIAIAPKSLSKKDFSQRLLDILIKEAPSSKSEEVK